MLKRVAARFCGYRRPANSRWHATTAAAEPCSGGFTRRRAGGAPPTHLFSVSRATAD